MKPAKWLVLLSCALWIPFTASGGTVDAQTAALAVKGWLRTGSQPFPKALGGQLKNIETYNDASGKPSYYVAYLAPSGFVIMSADDQAQPVIAIVNGRHFDPSPSNPLGALIAKDLPMRLANARAKASTAAGLKHKDEWQTLQDAGAGSAQPKRLTTGSILDVRVAPFIQTHWSQTTSDDTTNGPACYNFFTPPFAEGSSANYPCGCVATALAQLMYYFAYPSMGVATQSYTITLTTPAGGTHDISRNLRGGDGLGGPYAWTLMPLDPMLGGTSNQLAAIGALTSDAGVAVHMSYAMAESGAFMSDAKAALVGPFQYNNAVVVEATSLNIGFDLSNMLNPNLDARAPVLFGVKNDAGGHAIVCDGYGYDMYSTLYHHINMGWSGLDDAWYNLPILDLDETAPYINIDACIYNAFPHGTGEIISGRVLGPGGTPVTNATISAIGTKGNWYSAATDSQGIYALVGVPSDATFTVTVMSSGYLPLSRSFTTGTSMDQSAKCGNVWGADFSLIPAQGPPVIVTQPQDRTLMAGGNTTFSASAGGALPLSYRWQTQIAGSLNWNDLSDGGKFNGSTTPTLMLNQVDGTMNGESFRCVITNSIASATSSVAVLHVTVAPFLTINTGAGQVGKTGSSDGVGTNALFNTPRGIAVDTHANVYVADMYNHVIRKLTLSSSGWVVSTIAGLAGASGVSDGVNGDARFSSPYGVAVDGNGTVYVADTGNSTIRMVSPQGTNWFTTTIAGLAGSPGTNNGIGSSARFRFPTALAADSAGNVFVADQANSAVRKLTPSSGTYVITTIAGSPGAFGNMDGTNGFARFAQPYGVAVDQNGIVYVADKYSDTIRKVAPSGLDWVVTTIAGQVGNPGSTDGVGSDARFNGPTSIAAGPDGYLYVADQGNNVIRLLTPAETNWIVFTIAGSAGSSGSADGTGNAVRFNAPFGIAVDLNTNVYISDSLNDTIRIEPATAPAAALLVHVMKQPSDGSFALVWGANAGQSYRVQFKTELAQPVWTDLTIVTASSGTATFPISTGLGLKGFYRVVPTQ
jgi:streptogramin lyase